MVAASQKLQRMPTNGDLVVLVHGFFGKRIWMYPLSFRMRRHGFRTSSWTYSSLTGSIEEHGQWLREHLLTDLAEEPRIHILAHSMGSIIVRQALSVGKVPNLGRVVFLAPPNRGSPVARRAERLVGSIWRVVSDLSDRSDSFVNRMPSRCLADFGIIAAKYDALVPASHTHLDGEQNHRTLSATHNSLLFSRTAANLAGQFLRTGRFDS